MSQKPIFLNHSKAQFEGKEVRGEYVVVAGEKYYKISNSDTMRPFFMSLVSDGNHWMFISSNGGVTAGRKNSDFALFPYYTDDKITEAAEITGSKTLIKVQNTDGEYLWEPFSDRYQGVYDISRNLYKNIYGNKIVFEEINQDLGLKFRYQWNTSNLYGFVRKATLDNISGKEVSLSIIDGIQNILPYGVNTDLQNTRSNLVDAYKKNEVEADTGLGIYSLSAIIVDKAEPSEALKANIAWSLGMEDPDYLISSRQLDAFRKGNPIKQESDIRAEKGAYFLHVALRLKDKGSKDWLIVANVNQGPSAIANLNQKLKRQDKLWEAVEADIDLGTHELIKLAAASDALQCTQDGLRTARHFSNVLFNIMRGGIFDNNYDIDRSDFATYLQKANSIVWSTQQNIVAELPEVFTLKTLGEIAYANEDPDFKRLCIEYMPLKFSRRHGDPSRPWNKFSINTQSEKDGSKILDYEGNWRDIFQNWEALAYSYPEFIDSMIHKFLNASTFDGYNPYRITKSGIDWEVVEPDDPWSYIGYWGDHQIIYLLKFLEIIQNFYPGRLAEYFEQEIFVYANVPYRIKEYGEILKDPKNTIDFDQELEDKIDIRRGELGADGALLTDQSTGIYRVNLMEKILATVLAKCANFIPEAGIWLNTQRPEWNDANNALVGNGVSMVTLYYLRRFLAFFTDLIRDGKEDGFKISSELADFFEVLKDAFISKATLLDASISNTERKDMLDVLGMAGSAYRDRIYEHGFSGEKKTISAQELHQFCTTAQRFMEHSIDANRRDDGMYHSYNLVSFNDPDKITISYLNEMLEGQVAVLSSLYLSAKESLDLLDNLKKSALFRDDQYSYLLYPDKDLPRFLNKNIVPAEAVENIPLITQLLKDGDRSIIERDEAGQYHFNGSFNNAESLKAALSMLPSKEYSAFLKEDTQDILDLFELVFDHTSFTGRSGTFFGYEGLGSIYWHMVSKLFLAVEETCTAAKEFGEDSDVTGKLIDHYFEINAGIGMHKSPDLYGAFPTDPYSHTPAYKGAQQPGMTGQVKEDILSRIGELGVQVKEGRLRFGPGLFNKTEFLNTPEIFHFVDVDGQDQQVQLLENSLGFTCCQVPVIYQLSDKEQTLIEFTEGESQVIDGLWLDENLSKAIFKRNGSIRQIIVSFAL